MKYFNWNFMSFTYDTWMLHANLYIPRPCRDENLMLTMGAEITL